MLNVGNLDAGKINRRCIRNKKNPKVPEYSLPKDKNC